MSGPDFGELKSASWRDAGVVDKLSELSKRFFSRPGTYQPPYKTGAAWLHDFLNKPNEQMAAEYQFGPDSELIEIGLAHTAETYLGAIYNRILHEEDEYYDGRDVSKFGHVRSFVVDILNKVQQNVRHLQDEPDWIYEAPLLSYTSHTFGEAEEELRKDVSGYGLRWNETKAEHIERQVKRAALLRALNFPMGDNNMVTGQLNFASRIISEDDSQRKMMLYWGWGNPHVFYGIDVTESAEVTPEVTLTEKVIVASAYRVGNNFVFVSSFPQDMVYCIPNTN